MAVSLEPSKIVPQGKFGAQDPSVTVATPTPYGRLRILLQQEWLDGTLILVYTAMIGLLSLAVPLSTQALVNTIAYGVFLQPLVVLSFLVLGCLLFAGLLQVLRLVLAERLQQRIFARVALDLALRLPFVRQSALADAYAPHLVNRFFDVLNVQKTLSKLLIDVPASAFQILVGLLLMVFYSPLLLVFALCVVLFILITWLGLGVGGLQTSIKESSYKYHVADWLEELGRCNVGFKLSGNSSFPLERTDKLVLGYINARQLHFRVLLRQAIGNAIFRAIANAGVLAIGGWLVINAQFTIGQLVAAEIVLLSVLSALDKIVRMLEDLYDLLTSLHKLGQLTDLPAERQNGVAISNAPTSSPQSIPGASVVCRGVRFSYQEDTEVLCGLDLDLEPGAQISLVGTSGAGKSTLAALLVGLQEPSHGLVMVNSVEVRSANLENLRKIVSLVNDSNEIFEGSIEENILLGRPEISPFDMEWALETAQLTEELAKMPKGLKTTLISGGRNLSRGQLQRLLIARAIITRPHLLILDEAFTGIDERDKLSILECLYAEDKHWTIIDISHDPEVVIRSDTIYVLEDGKLVETHTGIKSKSNFPGAKSRFAALFPSLRSSNLPPSYVKTYAASPAPIQTNASQIPTNATNSSAS